MKTNKLKQKNNMPHFCLWIFLFSIISLNISANKKPDFSGTWSLNTEKSQLGERGWADQSKIIKQDSVHLVIERTFKGFEGQETKMTDQFTLDGKECTNKGFRNSERKSTVSWSEDEKTMVIITVVTFERDGEMNTMNITEKLYLTEEGKSLTLETTTQRGTQKAVYDRK